MYSIRATFLNLVLKGHPTWLQWIDDRDTVKIAASKRPVSALCAFLFAANKNQVSISMVKSSLSKIFLCLRIQICQPKTNFWLINRPIVRIPQCTKPVAHNAPFCNRNILENGALWVICLMHCGICEMAELFIILLFSDF